MNLFHIHRWKDSRLNRYYIATEQKCRCGQYRHHTFRDLGKLYDYAPAWQPGQHPESTPEPCSGRGVKSIRYTKLKRMPVMFFACMMANEYLWFAIVIIWALFTLSSCRTGSWG